MSVAEQFRLSEYAVRLMAARRGFHRLRPCKRMCFMYNMGEQGEVHAHRRGFTPSGGRE